MIKCAQEESLILNLQKKFRIKKIYAGALSKEISATLKTTYPTKRVEISKISVVNPGNLMEIPPEDDELERILEEAEKRTSQTKSEESRTEEKPEEKTSDDEINYQSMKVAELKVMLKEKKLPVSGTKAELIERLQT